MLNGLDCRSSAASVEARKCKSCLGDGLQIPVLEFVSSVFAHVQCVQLKPACFQPSNTWNQVL